MNTPTPRPYDWRPYLYAGMASVSGIITGVVFFGSSGRDDSHITHWVASNLARGSGLTNYNGDPVEQSSSLGHVLILALVRRISGVDVTTVAWWAGIIAVLVTALMCAHLVRSYGTVAMVTAAAATSWTVPVAYWALGGLETTLFGFAAVGCVGGIVAWDRGHTARWVLPAAAVVFIVMRPEAVFIATAVATAVLAAAGISSRTPASWHLTRVRWRGSAAYLGFSLVAFTAVTGWRLAYTGSWWPRPVTVKTGDTRISEGVHYLAGSISAGVLIVGALFLIGVMYAVRTTATSPQNRQVVLIAAAFAAAGVASAVAAGGDWMEGGRLVAPWLMVAGVPAGVGAAVVIAAVRPCVRYALAVALGVGMLASIVTFADTDSTGTTLWQHSIVGGQHYEDTSFVGAEHNNRVHARDIMFIPEAEQVLDKLVEPGEVLTVASGQGGMVAASFADRYGSDIEFIDRFGLTGTHLDVCRDGLTTSATGAQVTWEAWMSSECYPLPDVVFDLGKYTDYPELEQAGYQLMYEQTGLVTPSTDRLRGGFVSADQFLAVRCEAAAVLASGLCE